MWKLDLVTLLSATLVAFFVIRPLPLKRWVKVALSLFIFGFAPRYAYYRLFRTGFMSPETMPNVLVIYLLWHAMFLWVAAFFLIIVACVKRFWKALPLWTALAVSMVLTTYMVWSGFRANPPVVEHIVELEGLPNAADGLRIVILADMHIDQIRGKEWCENLVNRVNALQPDLILFTGDQSDGGVEARREDLTPLAQLKARLGKFAIGGNHEAWFDAPMLELLQESYGVQSLNDEVVEVAGLTLVGIEDERSLADSNAVFRLEALMTAVPQSAYPILLSHKPAVAKRADALGVRMQFSGHTHGGQLPLVEQIIAHFNGGFVRGWYDLPHGMQLFVAPGCGVWSGFPYRLYSPEISLLILKKKEAK
ncbi:MAG: metallophosphoesterase [bacterium]|nr:metallophosphoesterase [bacterium]